MQDKPKAFDSLGNFNSLGVLYKHYLSNKSEFQKKNKKINHIIAKPL